MAHNGELDAEEAWKRGERAAAIACYDAAIVEARAAGNAEREGSLSLAKGVALLQQLAQQQQQEQELEHSPEQSAEAEAAKGAALRCLARARAIAAAGGHNAQVQFVDMIVRREGLLPLVNASTIAADGVTCTDADGAHAECSSASHAATIAGWAEKAAAAAAAVAAATAATSGGDDQRRAAQWHAAHDVALVRLVSRLGVRDWSAVAAALPREVVGDDDDDVPSLPVDAASPAALAARWAVLRPGVRDAIRRSEEEGETLGCGHACATCPTRVDCKLHDVVDLEDVVS